MSLEWLQKPWIYILKDSTLLVICRAIASDSASPGSGIFWRHLLVLGPHSDSYKMCQHHRGLPSTLAGLVLVSWDRGGAMHVQNEKTGQALQLLSQQVSSASWIFYGPEGIQHLLRLGLWSLSKSSHPPPFIFQSNPTCEATAWGWKTAGKQPHSHTRNSMTTPVDTVSSFSIVSVGGRSGLHHFPRVTLQKHYSG